MSSYLYGNYINEMTNSIISKDDYVTMLENLVSYYIEEEDQEYYLSEGAGDNAKIHSKFHKLRKKYTEGISEFRRALSAAKKSGSKEDKDKCKKIVDDLVKVIDEYEKEIRDIDAGSFSNIVTGAFLTALIHIMYQLPNAILHIISLEINSKRKANKIISMGFGDLDSLSDKIKEFNHIAREDETLTKLFNFNAFFIFIKNMNQLIRKQSAELKGHEHEKLNDDNRKLANVYRTQILSIIDKYKIEVGKLKSKIDIYL